MRALLPLLLLCSCTALPEAPLLGPTNRLDLLLGARLLESDPFDPVEDQGNIGLVGVFLPAGTGVGGVVGVSESEDSGKVGNRDVDGDMREVWAGSRFSYGTGLLRPWGGFGLSLYEFERKTTGGAARDDEDDGYGVYLEIGADYWISDRIAVGAGYRRLFNTRQRIASIPSDLEYDVLGITIGWRF